MLIDCRKNSHYLTSPPPELPPELGSCSNLTVLTAASNRLISVPAELGHLPRLAVLNLCDNLIPYLPVSLTKLKVGVWRGSEGEVYCQRTLHILLILNY